MFQSQNTVNPLFVCGCGCCYGVSTAVKRLPDPPRVLSGRLRGRRRYRENVGSAGRARPAVKWTPSLPPADHRKSPGGLCVTPAPRKPCLSRERSIGHRRKTPAGCTRRFLRSATASSASPLSPGLDQAEILRNLNSPGWKSRPLAFCPTDPPGSRRARCPCAGQQRGGSLCVRRNTLNCGLRYARFSFQIDHDAPTGAFSEWRGQPADAPPGAARPTRPISVRLG